MIADCVDDVDGCACAGGACALTSESEATATVTNVTKNVLLMNAIIADDAKKIVSGSGTRDSS
jgi:hypothetical protein